MGPIKLESREDVTPICPHCSAELETLWFRKLQSVLGKRYIYFCSACRKILGVSHRKGFFMG